jgi:hypothetical protein
MGATAEWEEEGDGSGSFVGESCVCALGFLLGPLTDKGRAACPARGSAGLLLPFRWELFSYLAFFN